MFQTMPVPGSLIRDSTVNGVRNFIFSPFITDFWGTAESLFTITALIVGGIWTYILFFRRRVAKPKLNLDISASAVPGPDATQLLQIRIGLVNRGEVLLRLGLFSAWVQQISPIPPEMITALQTHDPLNDAGELEIPWPRIASRNFSYSDGEAEIEPGESEEVILDFVIPMDVAEIQIYAYCENKAKTGRKRSIGWSKTSRLRLAPGEKNDPWTAQHLLPTETMDMTQQNRGRPPRREEKQQPPKPRPQPIQEQKPPKPPPPLKEEDNG